MRSEPTTIAALAFRWAQDARAAASDASAAHDGRALREALRQAAAAMDSLAMDADPVAAAAWNLNYALWKLGQVERDARVA